MQRCMTAYGCTRLHVTWRATDQWRFDVDVQRSLASTDAIDLTMGSPTRDVANSLPFIDGNCKAA